MPVIQGLNASNASITLQYGNYTDFNIWIIVFVIIFLLVFASRYLPAKDDVGRFLIAVLAVIFSVASVWGSLGIAHLDYATGATLLDNSSNINQSITYNYIYPVQQVVSSQAMTVVCVAVTVFTVLNAVDIFLVMMQRPSEDLKKRGGGKGVRI